MNQYTDGWSAERTAFLKSNWTSTSATYLGTLMGLTKNAIIGKAHRLGLERKKAQPTYSGRPKVRKSLQAQPRSAKICAGEPIGPGVPLQWLRSGHCRYIGGEVRGAATLFCGAPKGNGSYCAFHAKMCLRGSPKLVLQ